jgi:hypothetical protein
MMGTQRLIAELNLLMDAAQREPEDLHELHFRVVEMMNQLRAMGEPIPEDLLRFERELTDEVEKRSA